MLNENEAEAWAVGAGAAICFLITYFELAGAQCLRQEVAKKGPPVNYHYAFSLAGPFRGHLEFNRRISRSPGRL